MESPSIKKEVNYSEANADDTPGEEIYSHDSSVGSDSSSKEKAPRKSKGSEQTRRSIVINHANVKTDMTQSMCGRSKGPNTKCCNSNMCRNLFLDNSDAPDGLEDLALISTVLLLRAELYHKDGVQVKRIVIVDLLKNKIVF